MPGSYYDVIFRPYYAPLVTLFFLALNVFSGYIFIPDTTTTPIQYRELGGALAFPLISGVCFFFLPVLNRKAYTSILQSARLSESSMRHARAYANRVSRVPSLSIRFSILMGSIVAISYMAMEGLLYVDNVSVMDNLRKVPLLFQAVYFWIAVTLLITSLVRITSLITRFATRDLRIELFHIEELVPLADSVLWNAISISIALALVPIFWMGRGVPTLDIPLITMALLTTLYLLLFPIFQVRNTVSKKKKLALERIRDAFKKAVRPDDSSKRRLTDSPKRLEEINNLVGVRKEISRTKEWPISIPVGVRIGLVVLVPPISWAAASLVDWMVLQLVS